MHDDDTPIISLGKPILITKNSDPKVNSNYLKDRIDLAIDSYYLDDTILEYEKVDGPGVIINYSKINLF
jgi:hypothetical protein